MINNIMANPIVNTLGIWLLIEKALRRGAINDPNCEKPYIAPAPMDCISKGND